MNYFIDHMCFRQEWSAPDFELCLSSQLDQHHSSDLDSLVRLGKATKKIVPCGLSGGSWGDIILGHSIAVKERHQYDLERLPLGARTLLLSTTNQTGSSSSSHSGYPAAENVPEIVLRGLNKFPSIHDVSPKKLYQSLDALPDDTPAVQVFLQKKMAGFIVHVCSLDGVHLLFSSKHSTDGAHVDRARFCFEKQMKDRSDGGNQEALLARRLFELNAVLSGECISTSFDPHHPTLDNDDENDCIHFFSLQRRNTLAEISFPRQRFVELCQEFSLAMVPSVKARRLQSSTPQPNSVGWRFCAKVLTKSQTSTEDRTLALPEIVEACQQWNCQPFGAENGGEGFVLVVQVPARQVHHATHGGTTTSIHLEEASKEEEWMVEFRVKIKTAKYELLRSARSTILGETAASSTSLLSSSLPDQGLLVAALAQLFCTGNWNKDSHLKEELNTSDGNLGKILRSYLKSFVQEYGIQSLLRSNDIASSPQRLQQLDLVGQVSAEMLYPSKGSITFLMLCGLPGSGKSTLVDHILSDFQRRGVDNSIVVVSRDAEYFQICKEEMGTQASGVSMSGGKQRTSSSQQSISKHKERRLKKTLHFRLTEKLSELMHPIPAAPYSATQSQQRTVIFDACNADANARAHWLSLAPKTATVCVLELQCATRLAAQRAASRENHLTLEASEAQSAVSKIQSKFTSPTLGEVASFHHDAQVLQYSTESLTVEEIFDRLRVSLPPFKKAESDDDVLADHSQVSTSGAITNTLAQKGFSPAPISDALINLLPRTDPVIPNVWTTPFLDLLNTSDSHGRHRDEVITCMELRPPAGSSDWKDGISQILGSLGEAVLQSPELEEGNRASSRLKLVAGCTGWLKGFILKPQKGKKGTVSREEETQSEVFKQKLLERFNVDEYIENTGGGIGAHLTLAHRADMESRDSSSRKKNSSSFAWLDVKAHISRYLKEYCDVQLNLGEEDGIATDDNYTTSNPKLVQITATKLLVDPNGVALGGISLCKIGNTSCTSGLSQHRPWWFLPKSFNQFPRSFHITLGLHDSIAGSSGGPSYCGFLEADLEDAELQNDAIDETKRRKKRVRGLSDLLQEHGKRSTADKGGGHTVGDPETELMEGLDLSLVPHEVLDELVVGLDSQQVVAKDLKKRNFAVFELRNPLLLVGELHES